MKDRWPFLALVAVILCFPLISQSYFVTRLGVVLAINAIIVVGMTLLIRYAGVFSMGQSAFFAIGAYLSGVLTVHLHMNPWLAMGIGGLASVFAAYLFCAPFLRLRAIMLAIATLGLATVDIHRGEEPRRHHGRRCRHARHPLPEHRRLHARQGLADLLPVRGLPHLLRLPLRQRGADAARTRLSRHPEQRGRGQASGIDVQRNMRNIFCFAALLASIAGSLLAHFITFISPESFRADVGLTLLIVVIIGGANIWAGILTTVILMGFSEASRGFQDLSAGLYALLLMVIFFVFPDGLSSVLFSATARPRGPAACTSLLRAVPPSR